MQIVMEQAVVLLVIMLHTAVERVVVMQIVVRQAVVRQVNQKNQFRKKYKWRISKEVAELQAAGLTETLRVRK
jgi:hypothetical protein